MQDQTVVTVMKEEVYIMTPFPTVVVICILFPWHSLELSIATMSSLTSQLYLVRSQ